MISLDEFEEKKEINKKEIIDSYVAYEHPVTLSRRVGKVTKLNGNTITVVDSLGGRCRVYKDKVIGVVVRNQGLKTIPIRW